MMKRGVIHLILLAMVSQWLVGCGGAPSPSPDTAAMETAVAARVLATLTAQATTPETPTMATPTVAGSPTPTPSPTATPSPTPLPEWQPVPGGDDLITGAWWEYIAPEAAVIRRELVVTSPGDWKSPINDYLELEVEGDFAIEVTMTRTKGIGPAGVDLYTGFPIGEWWEFEKGKGRVSVGLEEGLGKVVLNVHDGSGTDPNPQIRERLPRELWGDPSQPMTITLRIAREGTRLAIYVIQDELATKLIETDASILKDAQILYLGATVGPGTQLTVERLALLARGGEETARAIFP